MMAFTSNSGVDSSHEPYRPAACSSLWNRDFMTMTRWSSVVHGM